MNGKSDRPISFSVSFYICGRSFKLISFTFVCERETLGAVHSTQLWVLVKYHLFLIIISTISKFYLWKHFLVFKQALWWVTAALTHSSWHSNHIKCHLHVLGKQNLFEITNEQNSHLLHVQTLSGHCVRMKYQITVKFCILVFYI